jgi:hypothetical protein
MTDVHYRAADGLNSTPVSLANPLPVAPQGSAAVQAQPFTTTDGSAAIASGGVAQSLFGGAAPAHGFAVYNPDPVNDLWVSDGATASANGQGAIRVAANGGGYETPPFSKPIGVVSILGAATGQKFTARSW